MASASVERGAARAPPPPDQLAAFYKLVDKTVISGALCRHARHAELSASAAAQAETLLGDNSLVVAHLRMAEHGALNHLAATSSGAELVALIDRFWTVLVSVLPLLLRRLEANTLLPGTIKEEEVAYYAHAQAALEKARIVPVSSPAWLREGASTMGYNTLVLSMIGALDILRHPLLSAAQKRMMETFVLLGLDVIPLTAGIPADWMTDEETIVAMIEENTNPRTHGPAFCAAVLRKWRSNAVSSVLQARGVLQTGIAKAERDNAEFDARERADVAKYGLRDCSLPSCSKTEKTAKEFAHCTGCRSVVYCCAEHQALDWDAHKQACSDIIEHGLRDCALPSCFNTEETVKEFAGCSGCRSVVYCCLEHQALDWRTHRKACREKDAARLAA